MTAGFLCPEHAGDSTDGPAMTTTEWVLVGGLLVSLVGHAITWWTARTADEVAEATVALSTVQASDLLNENLLAEIRRLEGKIDDLTDKLDAWERGIASLPPDVQAQVSEAVRKARRPKAR